MGAVRLVGSQFAHEQPLDQQQADRDPRDPSRPPPPRPDLAQPGSIQSSITSVSFENSH